MWSTHYRYFFKVVTYVNPTRVKIVDEWIKVRWRQLGRCSDSLKTAIEYFKIARCNKSSPTGGIGALIQSNSLQIPASSRDLNVHQDTGNL